MGEQPTARVHWRYQWLWVYGFVQPHSGENYWWLLPKVNIKLFRTTADREVHLHHWKRATTSIHHADVPTHNRSQQLPGAAELAGIHSGQAAPAGGDRKDCLRALIKKLSQQSFLEVASRKASDKLYFQALPATSLSIYQHQLSRQKVVAALLTLRLPEREAGDETLF
jgi:hypothetical protein